MESPICSLRNRHSIRHPFRSGFGQVRQIQDQRRIRRDVGRGGLAIAADGGPQIGPGTDQVVQQPFELRESVRAVIVNSAAQVHHHQRSGKQNASDGLLEESLSGFIDLFEHGSQEFAQQHSALVNQQIFVYHFWASLFLFYGPSKKTILQAQGGFFCSLL